MLITPSYNNNPLLNEDINLIQYDQSKQEKQDKKIKEKWLQLGLSSSVIETDPDCVRILITSGIIYPLVGYANSFDHSEAGSIRLENEQLMLKIQGSWKSWKEINQLLMQDPKNKTRMISRNNPGQVWSYVSHLGFIPKDRLHYEHIYPVALLSEAQYEKVKALAKHFLDKNSEVDVGIEKTGILQLMTTSQQEISTPFYLEHCTIRIIRKVNGKYELYSMGSEMTENEYRKTMPGNSWISTSILTTVETKIGMCDFQEFRHKDLCRVTSIPLSEERTNAILKMIDQISQKQLRFNYIQQNCLSLVHEVMKLSGYEMPDLRITPAQLLCWKLINHENSLIRRMNDKVLHVFGEIDQMIPSSMRNVIKPICYPAHCILNKVSTVFTNFVVAAMGGWKMSMPLAPGSTEDPLSQNQGMISFSRLIRSPLSLWEDGPSVLHHSLPLIEWQLKQLSTFVTHPKKNMPKLHILSDD